MTSTLTLADGVLRGCLDGPLPSMKNGRRLVRRGWAGTPASIKSADALGFMKRVQDAYWIAVAAGTLEPGDVPMTGALRIHAWVYQDGRRRQDVDIELLCDSLQAVGLVADDFDFWDKRARRRIDARWPRVEFEVGRFEEDGRG